MYCSYSFDEKLDIYSFISDDKEEIMVQEKISTEAARGCVELWLLQVIFFYSTPQFL